MRAIALSLLVACAPLPASLPAVRIDRSLSGAVVSREAAETIAALRERERGGWAKQLVDEQQKTKSAETRERAAAWWRDNAPWVIIVIGVAAFSAGAAAGSQLRPR